MQLDRWQAQDSVTAVQILDRVAEEDQDWRVMELLDIEVRLN